MKRVITASESTFSKVEKEVENYVISQIMERIPAIIRIENVLGVTTNAGTSQPYFYNSAILGVHIEHSKFQEPVVFSYPVLSDDCTPDEFIETAVDDINTFIATLDKVDPESRDALNDNSFSIHLVSRLGSQFSSSVSYLSIYKDGQSVQVSEYKGWNGISKLRYLPKVLSKAIEKLNQRNKPNNVVNVDKNNPKSYAFSKLFKGLSTSQGNLDDDYYTVLENSVDAAYSKLYEVCAIVWPSASFDTQHNGQGNVWYDELWFTFPDGKEFWFELDADTAASCFDNGGAKAIANHIWKMFTTNVELVQRMG